MAPQRIFEVSKIIKKNEVTDKVCLPMTTVEHMDPIMNGKKSMELTAFDRWGQPWPLKYCSYILQTGKPKNPVLSGAGWHKIVSDNGVLADDELIFSGHRVAGADGVQYMIEVKRQIKTLDGELATVEVVKLKSQASMTFKGKPMEN
ncbi:hypothetical protein Dsin_023884 [Dipteronia sinensis]|uniref:TF-B3 domain-containing protein n=1 Tax=Dipteronia sinensis TaxID=43782 RepID=A0AAE0E1G7_9ROSI|nr:hypothetical protein Dsin_023884 [Dipteronia sinensis]